MPDWWSWTALAVGLLVVCVLVPVAWLVARRRWLSGRHRVFECSLHRPGTDAGSWMMGIARFRDETVEWYRVFSLSLRPAYTFTRGTTRVLRVRQPEAAEAAEVYTGHVVADLDAPYEGMSLAMSRPDLNAFSSWTEAAPPGDPARPLSAH